VLLIAPSANRVYAEASVRLTMAELTAFGRVLSGPLESVSEVRLGGVRYVGFAAPAGLTGRDLAYLANLSSIYALFEVVGELLRPVPLQPLARFDDDLITIPKYAGKTNEQFTKLLLNLTLLAGASAPRMLDGQLTVLDPLCGRGTTLNQALMYGYDAIGIERDGKDVDAYSAFLRTWLRRKRIKHRAELRPVRKDRRLVARRFEATIGPDGPGAAASDAAQRPSAVGHQRVVVYHGDTVEAREFLRAECADVIVADAPYGVAHGSHTGGGRSRDPLALLRAAVPVWVRLLRPGGALGLSWNTYVAKRADAAQVLAEHGLSVVDGPGYLDVEHRVDQAINRDVLVARR
jgi:SAM-dependent methyltransferase